MNRVNDESCEVGVACEVASGHWSGQWTLFVVQVNTIETIPTDPRSLI